MAGEKLLHIDDGTSADVKNISCGGTKFKGLNAIAQFSWYAEFCISTNPPASTKTTINGDKKWPSLPIR